MTGLVFILGGLGLCALGYFIRVLMTAPEGYQDETGFHRGVPPQIADGEGWDLRNIHFIECPGSQPTGSGSAPTPLLVQRAAGSDFAPDHSGEVTEP